MKRQPNQPKGAPARGAGTVYRFLAVSAFLGLLIGIFEAARLWTTPRVIPLLAPDVGWVIWFLAPLVDMAFFALVGLGLGLAASRTRHKELFVAAGVGVTVTFVTLMLVWFHREIGLHALDFQMEVTTPLALFGLVTFVSFLVLAVAWSRLAAFANRWLDRLTKPLARVLGACAAAAILGIGIFVVRPSFSETRLRAAAPPPPGAPNIVFITLDTVRADHLSSYGYSRPTTPNIDRFARTGVLFENAIAPSSWTLASHASMFTGLLPQQHGADWAVPLAQSPWTLAEILRSQGYQTASFVANELYLQKGWGVAQGFERYVDERSTLSHNLSETLVGTAIVQPLYRSFSHYDYFDRENAGQLNQRVFRWLRRNPQRPYFLFVNYFDAHNPYFPPAPYNRRFGQLTSDVAGRLFMSTRTEDDSVHFSPVDRESLMAGYDNSLAYLDSQVENFLAFLRQSPQWGNTVVIITSDHGEQFGGHGSYEHGRNLYRGVLRVPLIISGPGIPQGVRIGQLAATRRLFSTVLDLAGHGSTLFSRTSLARFWDTNFTPAPADSAVVSQLVPFNDFSAQRGAVSLTTPEWHYILHRDGRQELYSLATDPKEHENLAAAPGEKARLEELRSRLVDLVGNAVGPWTGPEYLDALDSIEGPARLSLLRPQPFQPDAAVYRIGMAQAFFKPDESAPTRPSESERELIQSLPYQ